MSKVFINPGHCPNVDSGAVNRNSGMQEADVALAIGNLVAEYLTQAGCDVQVLQSDNLYYDGEGACVCDTANNWPADVFVSIHCNAAGGDARGTEVEIYPDSAGSIRLGQCIQNQIVSSLGTIDRGLKERPNLCVLKHTDMTAVLVECAFIDNDEDAFLLANNQDDFAKAIARGITDAGY
jgi:N-acetylmuramoyl-L-alanine amidase